jgi:cysteine sulfinate desulfinase/cysteine desulfurase-like protein/rhodanese-related sulfurtransferase
MEQLYLDANATTPVLPQARAAAQLAMAELFGNPSSTHGAGLRARALLDEVRATARRALGVASGRLLFTSGATEGIQTAVLSALHAWRLQQQAGQTVPTLLLYGATEHKAVPEALRHWTRLLGLPLEVQSIPVDADGRHDLAWLRRHVADAALVCTMAANNETGVISDLDAIAEVLAGSPALWLVDGVQALGKLDLRLAERRIDYAPFSGHKLYAPKGIGMLYVRAGAPFTPLLAGGGQEDAQRAGTENMAGIAALGAVLREWESGDAFASMAVLSARRAEIAAALRDSFPGVVFNAPMDTSLPTTLNFSVPGISAKTLIDLFDAAGLRVSGGSACSAERAEPSYVLEAMGVPGWQAASAVRLSFGAAEREGFVQAACERLRACGAAYRANPVAQPDAAANAEEAACGDEVGAGSLEFAASALRAALQSVPRPVVVDVREACEHALDPPRDLQAECVPLPLLAQALQRWSALPAETPVIFVCRSGKRAAQAASALRRRGHANAWSLAGGLALWSSVN